MPEAITPSDAWAAVRGGEARILDLRTRTERRRHGWPPGAEHVTLWRHILRPEAPPAIYLCQHANRSKLTGRRGAPEIEGGFQAWVASGLPVEHEGGST